MRTVGTPWVFRRVFQSACASGQEVMIHHTDAACQFMWKTPFFGTRTESFNLDAKPVQTSNLWRAVRISTTWQDENRSVHMKTEGNKNLGPGGFAQSSFSLNSADQTLQYSMTAVFADGRDPCQTVLVFRRSG